MIMTRLASSAQPQNTTAAVVFSLCVPVEQRTYCGNHDGTKTQAEVADVLLMRCHMGAALSLEPVLALLGTLARDLRSDFLPLLPHVLGRLTELGEEGGTFYSVRLGCCRSR